MDENKSLTLDRFMKAQELDYKTALSEIQSGRKQSHWIWYIFPQLRGLGMSETSYYYGLRDIKEAKEYFLHPILGSRLVEISKALLSLNDSDQEYIMGYPDNLKLCSCMTLFSIVAPNEPVFREVLDKFYNGKRDDATEELINKNL